MCYTDLMPILTNYKYYALYFNISSLPIKSTTPGHISEAPEKCCTARPGGHWRIEILVGDPGNCC